MGGLWHHHAGQRRRLDRDLLSPGSVPGGNRTRPSIPEGRRRLREQGQPHRVRRGRWPRRPRNCCLCRSGRGLLGRGTARLSGPAKAPTHGVLRGRGYSPAGQLPGGGSVLSFGAVVRVRAPLSASAPNLRAPALDRRSDRRRRVAVSRNQQIHTDMASERGVGLLLRNGTGSGESSAAGRQTRRRNWMGGHLRAGAD